MNMYERVLLNHRSARRFQNKPVSRELIKRLVRCGQHAATSEFIQSYTIIDITDRTLQETIYKEVATQETLRHAPVLLIFLADVNRLLRASRMNDRMAPDGYLEATETLLMATIDTAIMAQTVSIAAEMEGLGCTYIGGIRNNLGRLCELLELPEGVYPLFGMVMGYPLEDTDELAKPRLPLEVVYKENRYDTSGDEDVLRDYDEVIRDYYVTRTGGERNETWTQQMSDFVEKPQRPGLRRQLENQGFKIK